jgi:hypothetical protein
MNRVKKGRMADRISHWTERGDSRAGDIVLARRLLISKAQRAVGKVGVSPSAPIDGNIRRKRLKLKALGLFQNGALLPSFGHGQRIGGKGKRLGQTSAIANDPARGIQIALRASK